MTDHATDVALFRYSLVRALIDESLSKAVNRPGFDGDCVSRTLEVR